MYFVYVIKNRRTGKVYIGFTSDLKKRIELYKSEFGGDKEAETSPFSLVYYEAYRAEQDARKRENNIRLDKRGHVQLKARIKKSLID